MGLCVWDMYVTCSVSHFTTCKWELCLLHLVCWSHPKHIYLNTDRSQVSYLEERTWFLKYAYEWASFSSPTWWGVPQWELIKHSLADNKRKREKARNETPFQMFFSLIEPCRRGKGESLPIQMAVIFVEADPQACIKTGTKTKFIIHWLKSSSSKSEIFKEST